MLRRRLTLAAVALLLPATAGCAAGFSAQTNQPYQPAEGVNDQSGEVFVIDTLVVTDGSGNGTLVAALVNHAGEPDSVVGVEVTDVKNQPVKSQASPIEIPAHQAVQLADNAAVRMTGDAIMAGGFLNVRLTFAHAAPVELKVPVVAAGTDFGDVPVGPISGSQ